MSKKTIIFSIVLIIVATFFGSEMFVDEELPQGVVIPEQTHIIAEMATESANVETQMQEWIISSYDEMMRRIGEEEGQDWLLLSAIAYNESRFHSDLVSKQGAIGLMQIMPIVGRQFNVEKEHIVDPETNIRLAGKLLKQIDKTLKLSPTTSADDRMSIILACYNGGIGHVSDARRLAKSNGEDYNSWEVVARYLKMKADPAVYESELVRYGKFTGSRQTEAYVREVMKRYNFYCDLVNNGANMVAQVK
ncbi:MAG: transglycosylase SLT domain-containing protein [Alistipes sp.]|nr:transglycosylase SLT domain-containing protein [Alistipes sp.]